MKVAAVGRLGASNSGHYGAAVMKMGWYLCGDSIRNPGLRDPPISTKALPEHEVPCCGCFAAFPNRVLSEGQRFQF